MRLNQILVGLAVWCVLFANAASANESLRIGGTGSGIGGIQILAAAFGKLHPGVTIEILPALGSAGGIAALLDNRLDLAISNRLPNDAELKKARMVAVIYARTPFVMAVHKNLGVSTLSNTELAVIYGTTVAEFPNGKRARPILRLNDSTDTNLLKAFSPAVALAVDSANARRGMLSAATDSDTADLVEKTPGGISVSTLALIESERRPLIALAIDGKQPTLDNLAKGIYPHSKSLVAIHQGQSASASRFVAYLQSPEARALMRAHGHLPIDAN